MKSFKFAAAALAACFVLLAAPARPQTVTPGVPVIPLGNCQISSTALESAVGFGSCQEASFTASCSGATLTASVVTGAIKLGLSLSGTGITTTPPTTVTAFGTGSGGAGTYTVSQACTSSSNSVAASGIPTDAQGRPPTLVVLFAESAAVRWKDDGSAPTTSLGVEIPSNSTYTYLGTLSQIEFIAATGSPILDAAFYKTSSP